MANYTLSTLGLTAFYLKQEKAMVSFFTNPPLTKAISTSPSKRAKANMAEVASSTMDTRVRFMRDFVGFSHKWQLFPPTLELVMAPQLVAKYFGFHVAKGNQASYMKNIASHLHQVANFVVSPHCPKTTTIVPKDKDTLKEIMDWYTNLNGSLLASITTHMEAKGHGITLWSVWQGVEAKWQAFQHNLKVSVGWLLGA